jgi:hypothetical protein
MAYARWGWDSDVYVRYGHEFECHGPDDLEVFHTPDPHLMLAHLRALELQGVTTGTAITRLTEEMAAGKW